MSTTRSNDEIRNEVTKAYASRVKGTLARVDEIEIPLVQAESCCEPSASTASCCGDDTVSDVEITNIARLYAGENLEELPSSVTDVAFGCGNPTAISAMKPGEVVLDLGSGGGIDCFLAAKMVGETGHVYGVDMTPEMVTLARKNREKVGATNVEFRLGEIEHLPIGDNSIDVIISNCVINLSPDKDQVFREAFRVLKPGGRLQVSDIVWTTPVPADVKSDMEKWAGCIGGALLESDYLAKAAAAGFTDVKSVAAPYKENTSLASAAVTAIKPAGKPGAISFANVPAGASCCPTCGANC